jgi:hypothetical protein
MLAAVTATCKLPLYATCDTRKLLHLASYHLPHRGVRHNSTRYKVPPAPTPRCKVRDHVNLFDLIGHRRNPERADRALPDEVVESGIAKFADEASQGALPCASDQVCLVELWAATGLPYCAAQVAECVRRSLERLVRRCSNVMQSFRTVSGGDCNLQVATPVCYRHLQLAYTSQAQACHAQEPDCSLRRRKVPA